MALKTVQYLTSAPLSHPAYAPEWNACDPPCRLCTFQSPSKLSLIVAWNAFPLLLIYAGLSHSSQVNWHAAPSKIPSQSLLSRPCPDKIMFPSSELQSLLICTVYGKYHFLSRIVISVHVLQDYKHLQGRGTAWVFFIVTYTPPFSASSMQFSTDFNEKIN